MSLNEEERHTIVSLEMQKADRFLKEANELKELGYAGIAANRYYYACFHAVQAILIANGISVKSHRGLIGSFGSNFIKTGKIDLELGKFLSRMEDLRQKADYDCRYNVTIDEVEQMKEPAEKLILAIRELLPVTNS